MRTRDWIRGPVSGSPSKHELSQPGIDRITAARLVIPLHIGHVVWGILGQASGDYAPYVVWLCSRRNCCK